MKVCFKNFVNLTDEEIKLVHTERNKSVIRKKMYNQNEIPFESHMEWISGLKNRSDCKYFLVFLDEDPVGVVDFIDITENSCEFGFYLFESYLRSGYGIILEKYSIDYIFENLGLELLNIAVLESNKNVYKNHMKYFGFVKDDKLDLIKDNNKFLGFSLSKSQWVCLDKTILNKCLSFFDIQEVNWE